MIFSARMVMECIQLVVEPAVTVGKQEKSRTISIKALAQNLCVCVFKWLGKAKPPAQAEGTSLQILLSLLDAMELFLFFNVIFFYFSLAFIWQLFYFNFFYFY